MRKKIICALVLTVIAAAGFWAGWQLHRDQAALAYNKDNLIRFHVMANSNTARDQALKFQVRDAVIQGMAPRFEGAENAAEARKIVKDSMPYIKELARSKIEEMGAGYPVSVSLGNYPFPAKSYNLGSENGEPNYLTLPEGTYEAVRVVIGEGNGANWWCVLFPPLCFTGASSGEDSDNAPDKGQQSQDSDEKDAVKAFQMETPPATRSDSSNPDQGIQVKFRLVQLYEYFFGKPAESS